MVESNPDTAPAHEILRIILAIMAVLLNGILLVAMFNGRKRIFVSRISYLVANLLFSDSLTGLAMVFVVPSNLSDEDTPKAILKYKLSIVWTPITISFFTLILMSAERVVVIVLPMSWMKVLTIRKTIACIVLIWCLSIVGGVLMDYDTVHSQFVLVIIMVACALLFITVNAYVLCLLRKRERQCKMSQIEALQSAPMPPELPNHMSPSPHAKKTRLVAILHLALITRTLFPILVCLQIFTADDIIDNTIS